MSTDWKKYQELPDKEKVEKIVGWLKSPRHTHEVGVLTRKLCKDDGVAAFRLYRTASLVFFTQCTVEIALQKVDKA